MPTPSLVFKLNLRNPSGQKVARLHLSYDPGHADGRYKFSLRYKSKLPGVSPHEDTVYTGPFKDPVKT